MYVGQMKMIFLKFIYILLVLLLGSLEVKGVSEECPCESKSLWMDLIFVVESTEAVSKQGLKQIESFIETALLQTTISPEQLRVGVIVYADQPKVVADLKSFSSTNNLIDELDLPFLGGLSNDPESALWKVTELFQKDHRPNVRKVAVLFAASLNTITSMPLEIANTFREDGGVLIAIEFVPVHGAHVPAIRELASKGYLLSTALEQLHVSHLIEALCDANCYCAAGHYPLTNGSRATPDGGCFLPSNDAFDRNEANVACSSVHPGASLPIINDQETNDLLFTLNEWEDVELWLGGKLIDGKLKWDRDEKPQTNAFQPIIHKSTAQEACLYAKQTSTQKIEWFSGDCSMQRHFICQSQPLSSKKRLSLNAHSKYRKLFNN